MQRLHTIEGVFAVIESYFCLAVPTRKLALSSFSSSTNLRLFPLQTKSPTTQFSFLISTL